MDLDSALRRELRGGLRFMAPLAPLTTYAVGGPAEWLAEPADEHDVQVVMQICRERGVPLTILGGGSNVLVADDGVRGVVLRTRPGLGFIRFEGDTVELGAGAWDPDIADHAAEAGVDGFRFMADLPGTLGGAVRMNAGNDDGELSAVALEITSLDAEGRRVVRSAEACAFAYRHSLFADTGEIVLSGRFRADLRASPTELATANARIRALRKGRFPTEGNCGSVFKRPPGDFAGRLIEAAGCKGLRVGQAQVSHRHAGFIVNLGGATACDVKAVIARVQDRVWEASGVRLERELVYLGP